VARLAAAGARGGARGGGRMGGAGRRGGARALAAALLGALLGVRGRARGAAGSGGGLQCLGPGGDAVDWWVAYKLPRGAAAAYWDATGAALPAVNVSDRRSALGRTMEQAYADGVAYVFYNDEVYDKLPGAGGAVGREVRAEACVSDAWDNSWAHGKGVVAANADTGFWLTHSVPGLPLNSTLSGTEWSFPEGQQLYAQTFLCLSASTGDLDSLSAAFLHSRPYVYDTNLGADGVASQFLPKMSEWVGTYWEIQRGQQWLSFETLGGLRLQVFGHWPLEGAAWDWNVWEGVVAPHLQSDMIVETWCDGHTGGGTDKACLPPVCDRPQQVVEAYTMDFGGGEFRNTDDHGKWGLSMTREQGAWLCFGDLNRMSSQRFRGGGVVCFQEEGLWEAWRAGITAHQECSEPEHPEWASARRRAAEEQGRRPALTGGQGSLGWETKKDNKLFCHDASGDGVADCCNRWR